MARKKRKQRRVPEVVWRIYHNKARTLSQTILSLLPTTTQTSSTSSSSLPCIRCRGQICLFCCGNDVDSFLIRRTDPPDYKKLLTRTYAVIDDNAPPLSLLYSGCRWSQQQIVRRTIERIMGDVQVSRKNVICNGYNKFAQSSVSVDLLTTSAWSLFQERIGDDVMVHLLKFVSIFLPVGRGNHHQVSGFPISGLCSKFSKGLNAAAFQRPLPDQSEVSKKRKRVNREGKLCLDSDVLTQHSSGSDGPEAKNKSKWIIPEVLRRIYGRQAHTLAETTIGLLHTQPPPPSKKCCRCKGKCCFFCSSGSSDSSMLYLLQRDDPSDYKKLLTESYAVVSDNAPPLSFFYSGCRWSQQQIVKRIIEMTMHDVQVSPNAICSGYNKCSQSSKVVDLLTTSAWSLFQKRIGDDIMVHLLKFVSIFLPLEHGDHHQVSGFPISDFCSKFSKDINAPAFQHPLPDSSELSKKKRKNDEDKFNLDVEILTQPSLGYDGSASSVNHHVGYNQRNDIGGWSLQMSTSVAIMPSTCSASDKKDISSESLQRIDKENTNSKKRTRLFSWQRRKRCRQLNFGEVSQRNHVGQCSGQGITSDTNFPSTCIANIRSKSGRGCLQKTNKKNANSKKRARPFSWERRKRCRRLSFAVVLTAHSDTTDYTETLNTHNISIGSCHHSVGTVHLQESKKKCLCFWMLQTPQKVAQGELINRKGIFYKSNCFASLFPKKHILNTSKTSDTGAMHVFKDIFGISDENLVFMSLPCALKCQFCLKGSPCLFHSLRKLLKCLLHKVRICHHSKLMDKHYTVEALEMSTMGEAEPMLKKDCIQPLENSSLHVNLLQQKLCQRSSRAFDHNFKHGRYCLKSQVVSFIWNVCRSIVPLELVGAPSNWRALRRNISKFVHLRKFENFSLKQCMHGLKTSCVPLLSNWYSSCYMNNHAPETGEKLINDYQKFSEVMAILKNNLFSYWIYWLFSRLVVPIVQSSFYVTEVEGGKLDMFYYRKPTWEKMSSKGVTCLREQNYRLLSDKSLSSILRKNSFGFSKVRFCPKENGMRVLANLKASSKFPIRSHLQKSSHNTQSCFKPVNDVLRDLGAVLKGLKMKNPEKLGSSVFNYNDVYKKLCPFLSGLKSRSSTVPSVYIVVCDISKAFDSVNQDKLLSVMKDVMLNEEYLLQFSSEVVCTKKCLWVHYGQKLLDPTMGTATMKSAPSVPFRVLHRVLTNQETSKMVWKAQLYQDLYQHVKWNMLLLEKQFYLQEVGIPQGSAVSSLLCSYYYAHMERNVIFPFLEKIQEPHTSKSAKTNLSGELICQSNGPTEKDEEQNTPTGPEHALLRFIDDFLFISTSKEQATSFFTRLQRGFRDYSCFINESKSCMNFDLGELSGLPSKKMYMGDDGISFLPWSGLLINFCTLEIQADYTRYLNIHVSSTLTVQWQNKPSCYLKDKLCSYLQPKCHPIFYDSNINSAATVRLNIYQAFLLCSMKFHCYVCNLSKVCTLQAEQYYEMIMSSLRYMHRLIRRRIFTVNGTGVHPVLHLKKIEVLWLGLKAYIRVLEKKQPRHSRLLYLLRSEMLGFLEVESASLR